MYLIVKKVKILCVCRKKHTKTEPPFTGGSDALFLLDTEKYDSEF